MASIRHDTDLKTAPTGTCGKILPFDKTGTSVGKYSENNKRRDDEIIINERIEYPYEEGDIMENNQILEKYIEKVDRDQSDLRADIRASEQRTSDRLAAIEERMDNRLNRIEDMISSMNDKLDSVKDYSNDSLKWNIGVSIATILGIAALVVAIFVK